MMYPSDKEFLKAIDNKVIQNCRVTRRDIIMAQNIFGKNKGIVQGKIVRQQTEHIREDITLVSRHVLDNSNNQEDYK